MMDTRDPAIKLFGKTISVPDFSLNSANHSLTSPTLAPSSSSSSSAALDYSLVFPPSSSSPDAVRSPHDAFLQKEHEGKHGVLEDDDDHHHHLYTENAADSSMGATTNKKHPSKTSSSPTATEPTEEITSQEKMLKKPDRVLPCPRCNSIETKFCYYNNYNVNQPRHFCKNCQRYWTAGGTMRNVPIGAGRRKNKTYTSQCRHITISDGLQPTHNDSTNPHSSIPNGGAAGSSSLVLTFGSDAPLCDSVHSGPDRVERQGLIYGAEESRCSVSCGGGDRGCEPTMADTANGNPTFPIQMPCFVSTNPWSYPWNQWRNSVPLHPNALYWDTSVAASWNGNLPCIPLPSCENQIVSTSASASPTPGKRTRMEASNPTETSDQFLCISKKKMDECITNGGICSRECDCDVKKGVSSTVLRAKQGEFSRVITYNEKS